MKPGDEVRVIRGPRKDREGRVFEINPKLSLPVGVDFPDGRNYYLEAELQPLGNPCEEIRAELGPAAEWPEPLTAQEIAELYEVPERFVTKSTGNPPRQFETGSQRDDRTGKGRYDLLPAAAIRRLAQLMERGAEKYGERNWELGQPLSGFIDSGLRHAFQVAEGKQDEDHAAAVLYNFSAFIHTAEKIAAGELPAELDDIGWTR